MVQPFVVAIAMAAGGGGGGGEGDLVFNTIDWHAPRMTYPGRSANEEAMEAYNAWSASAFVVYAFGNDAAGASVALRITGFKPYFYVRAPDGWSNTKLQTFAAKAAADASSRRAGGPRVDWAIEQKRDMWGFENGDTHAFVRFTCDNLAVFNRARRLFDKPRRKPGQLPDDHARAVEAWLAADDRGQVRTYEATVEPMLRLIHARDLRACGWVRVAAGKFKAAPEGGTACARSYTAHVNDVVPEHAIMRMAPMRIASFDIECTSAHGDFPQAIKTYRKLAGDLYMARRDATHEAAVVALVVAAFRKRDVVPKVRLADAEVEALAKRSGLAGRLLQVMRGQAGNQSLVAMAGAPAVLRAMFPPQPRAGEDGNRAVTGHRDMLTRDDLAQLRAHLRLPQQRVPADDDEAADARRQLEDAMRAYLPRLVRASASSVTRPAAAAADDSGSDEEGAAAAAAAATDPDKERALYLLTGLLTCALPPLEGDAIITISTTVHRFGVPGFESRHTAALTGPDGLGPMPEDARDVQAVACRTEREVIEAWAQHVSEVDPAVLTGYNIFGFDWEYLWDRAGEVGARDALKSLSRLPSSAPAEFKRVWSSSSAMGDNYNRFLAIPGRMSVDLLKFIQREKQLDSYKLDEVAKEFLGEAKHDVSPQDIFRMFKGGRAEDLRTIALYCVQDCALVNKLIIKFKVIENQSQMGNVCHVPMAYIFMRGQGVKIYSLVVKTAAALGVLVPTVRPCENGGCTARPAYDYPASWEEREKRRDRRCAACRLAGMTVVLPGDDADESEEAKAEAVAYGATDKYEGAIVLVPKPAMYLDEPIVVLDYNSLYPNSIRSENLCPSTLVRDEARFGAVPGATYNVIEVEGVKYKYCASQPGVLPIILTSLLDARSTTRKHIEYVALTFADGRRVVGLPVACADAGMETLLNVDTRERVAVATADVVARADAYDAFEKAVLDGRQLSLKVTANSLYGQTGARTSAIHCKAIAACTTAVGRAQILKAKAFVEAEFGGEVVYGDTDSIFIRFPMGALRGRDALVEAIRLGKEVERRVQAILKAPQKLAYEKVLFPWLIMTKKRYVGMLYEDDPDAKPKMKYMGIALKRRDNAPIVKAVFKDVLDAILNHRDVGQAVARLRGHLDRLKAGAVDMKELVVSKTLRAEYKDPTRIAHKVLAERMGERDAGNKPASNERIPYVYIKTADKAALQGDRIEAPAYVAAHKLPIDYDFYISNQIKVPISQLLALALERLPGFLPPAGADVGAWTEARRLTETQYLLFQPYLEATLPGCCARVREEAKAKEAEARRPPPGMPRIEVAKDGTWRLCGVNGAVLGEGDGAGAGASKDTQILRQLRGLSAALGAVGGLQDAVADVALVGTPDLTAMVQGEKEACKGGDEVLEDVRDSLREYNIRLTCRQHEKAPAVAKPKNK